MDPSHTLVNAETHDSSSPQTNGLRFLNRDHIVLASVQDGAVTLTTSLGTKLVVSGPPQTLEAFMDQLLNACGSNFVAVPVSQGAEEMIG